MNFIDAGVTMAVGPLLVARPQAFTKRRGSDAEPLLDLLRKLGYALIGVGVLLGVVAFSRP